MNAKLTGYRDLKTTDQFLFSWIQSKTLDGHTFKAALDSFNKFYGLNINYNTAKKSIHRTNEMMRDGHVLKVLEDAE